MPHPIFGIDELLRPVISELVNTSPRAAVAFAVTCRSFEEPTLSSLWKGQHCLDNLMKVLPNHTLLLVEYNTKVVLIEHDHPAKDWARLHRYASWMRELHLEFHKSITTDTLSQLSRNSPDGLLCPMLERLYWDADKTCTGLTFFRLFLSPHLKWTSFHINPITSGGILDTPWDWQAVLVQIISCLPTSLEGLSIAYGAEKDGPLNDAISSFICRCGPSLKGFETYVPLSEAAIRHLVQLPNLHTLYIAQDPPQTVPTSVLPSLIQLHLDNHALVPWLRLLASHGKNILQDGSTSAISHSSARGTLELLNCPRKTIVDSTFLSSIVEFCDLVILRVGASCRDAEGCSFRMTDDNVNDLAAALPRLEILELGEPCFSNTCNNTVASLLSISAHCLDLTALKIHFNTLTIVEDIQRMLDGGSGRDKAKCKLKDLNVGCMPLEVREEDIETVAMGLKAIFPCLTSALSAGYYGCWYQLGEKLCAGGSSGTRFVFTLGHIFGLG